MSGRSLSFFVVACFAVLPATASADLIVTIQNSIATEGTEGFFDIFLTSNSAEASADVISNYSIGLSPPSPSGGISFTQMVTAATDAPNGYIFPVSGPQNVSLVSGGLRYIDFGAATSVFVGRTFGVGRVFYDALSAGIYTVNFDFGNQSDPDNLSPTSFSQGFSEVPVVVSTSGTLTVLPAPVPAPEPSSAILLGLTGIAGVTLRRFRRKSTPEAETAA